MKYPNITEVNPIHCISRKMKTCDRAIANIFRKHLHPLDITDSQLSILFLITKRGPLAQKDLVTLLILEKSTVTRNIKRLLDKNYIKKDAQKNLSMTPTGKDFLEQVIPHWEQAMTETKTILGQEGIENLDALLHKLT
jgi:DNA-binding MarR family transcriptional regulator